MREAGSKSKKRSMKKIMSGVGVFDPKSNISQFQISRGWHLCNLYIEL